MRSRSRRLAPLVPIVVCAFVSGCTGMGFTRVKNVTPEWATEGNVALQVYHAGGNPRTLDMQFYVDGVAVGPVQRIGRGYPELRHVTYTVRLQADPGIHVLQVVIPGRSINAEKEFTVDDTESEVRGRVVYDGRDSDANDTPELIIDFDSGWIGFA